MDVRRAGARGALAVAGLVTVAGCGGGTSYRNTPRPPAPIVITASINDDRVSVSPARFGAGPISLVVTNQTGAAQRVTIESVHPAGSGPGLRQETAPISPLDTATLKADVQPGRYSVHVIGDAILAARLRVGPQRASAQGDLLQP